MKRVSNTHNEKYKEQRRIEFRESSLDKGTQNIKREMVCEYTEKKNCVNYETNLQHSGQVD